MDAPEPDLVAQLDQAVAGIRGVAEAVVVIYRTLREGGLPDQAAAHMTMHWWSQVITSTVIPTGGS